MSFFFYYCFIIIIIIDIISRVPVFPVPYTFDIHEAAVTSMEYIADCPPDLIRDLLAVGGGNKKKPLRREDSRQVWLLICRLGWFRISLIKDRKACYLMFVLR